MHEFSICKNIVDAVIIEYNKLDPKPEKLVATRIIVGRLHQIVPDTLTMAYEVLIKDTVAANSRLEIQFVEVQCRCKDCRWEGIIDFPFFICKQCKSGNIEIVKGRELHLENLEVEYT
ncbi:MAG: hydrogenase maturation nickel metallochaperone HypA [Spirochaetales bacterium]|nr:hydrogenase maturation nickel metallochaperone HypA [Spirochaetales bacterium]